MPRKMEDRETSAILAGLRLLEALRLGRIRTADAQMDVSIDDIESNGGAHDVLEADEIDALCQRINASDVLIEG